jgi:hypothetical protein
MNVDASPVKKEKFSISAKTTIISKIVRALANRSGTGSRISRPIPAHNEQRIMPLTVYGALERQKRVEEEMKKRKAMGKLF